MIFDGKAQTQKYISHAIKVNIPTSNYDISTV